jgi:hypothetical protein
MNKTLYNILIIFGSIFIIFEYIMLYLYTIIAIFETPLLNSHLLCKQTNLWYYLIFHNLSITIIFAVNLILLCNERLFIKYYFSSLMVTLLLVSIIIIWGGIELFAYSCIDNLKEHKIYIYSFTLWIETLIGLFIELFIAFSINLYFNNKINLSYEYDFEFELNKIQQNEYNINYKVKQNRKNQRKFK